MTFEDRFRENKNGILIPVELVSEKIQIGFCKPEKPKAPEVDRSEKRTEKK